MTMIAHVSVRCSDRTGLVADITGCLFDLGINLADASFSVLGRAAEFAALCELSADFDLAVIKDQLQALDSLNDAEITVTAFTHDASQDPKGLVTHHIEVSGGDRPGLIARLCEVCVQFDVNIVRLYSRKRQELSKAPHYSIGLSVWIPESHASACLATIANTAGELGLSCAWREASETA